MSLKIIELLKKFLFKLNQKTMYWEFEYYLKHNEQHLVSAERYARCSGKSITLVRLAHTYGLPIAVTSYAHSRYLNNMCKDLYGHELQTIVPTVESVRGKIFEAILIEEGLKAEQMLHLQYISGTLIGFYNYY